MEDRQSRPLASSAARVRSYDVTELVSFNEQRDGSVRITPFPILPVLGYCPHGANLDFELCPEGCRV